MSVSRLCVLCWILQRYMYGWPNSFANFLDWIICALPLSFIVWSVTGQQIESMSQLSWSFWHLSSVSLHGEVALCPLLLWITVKEYVRFGRTTWRRSWRGYDMSSENTTISPWWVMPGVPSMSRFVICVKSGCLLAGHWVSRGGSQTHRGIQKQCWLSVPVTALQCGSAQDNPAGPHIYERTRRIPTGDIDMAVQF